MVRLTRVILAAAAATLGLAQVTLSDELWDSLNGVQKMMTGTAGFNVDFYNSLVKCFNDLDPKLLQSVNAQWAGFKQYSEDGGNPTIDDWKKCPKTKWFENNCTVQEYGNIPIWEPCNYASNVAYYHTTVEICARNWYNEKWNIPDTSVKSIGKAFASLGLGSSFFHGSQTYVGDRSDVRVNDLFGWTIYQAMVLKLTAGNQSVIHDLDYRPRSISAVDVVDKLALAYINEPVKDWARILVDADFPDLRISMCGVFGTAFTLILPEKVVDLLTSFILDISPLVDEEMKEFCVDTFLPQIRIATASMLPLPPVEASQLTRNLGGTLIKLAYAFVWQEQMLESFPFFLGHYVNYFGARILPAVNEVATGLTNFFHAPTFDQSGEGFFPGQKECNSWNPHSKWHLESAIALPDMVYLADDIYRLIEKYSS